MLEHVEVVSESWRKIYLLITGLELEIKPKSHWLNEFREVSDTERSDELR